MNKLIKAFCLTLVLSFGVFAQTSDEYNKNEFFVGYSHQRTTGGGASINGVEASYVRNVSRYFGVKADFSGAFRSKRFSSSVFDGTNVVPFTAREKVSLYNFLGGVQIKDNATKSRFKPFAHALVGAAHRRRTVDEITFVTTPVMGGTFQTTRFSGAFGGGLDIKVNDRIDIRAIQVDYNPIFSSSDVSHGVRFGIGIVFK